MSRSTEKSFSELMEQDERIRKSRENENKPGCLTGFIPLILTLVLIGLLYLMGII
jgi:hypothetical protein